MFQSFEIEHGKIIDRSSGPFPYTVTGLAGEVLALEGGHAHIGMVTRGEVSVADQYGECRLVPGTFFSINHGTVAPLTADARALIISAPFYNGLRQFGGPLEATGRLQYVDGCSDTLLLAPARKGEPCLNHLHIPAHVPQRWHYHPSDRVGVVSKGHGICHTEAQDFALAPGIGWHIPAGMNHCFETDAESLDVIAWHPDSDFGPTDEDHPMINRTWAPVKK